MIIDYVSSIVERPYKFKCDFCNAFIVIDDFDLDIYDDDNVIILKYSTPSGGFSSDCLHFEKHFCSLKCAYEFILNNICFDCDLHVPCNHRNIKDLK